jgi:hypothetical protein
MAEIVDRMPEAYELRRKYDWNAWLNGEVWQLRQGVDFEVPVRSIAAQTYQAADRRGVTVAVAVNGKEAWIRIQAQTYDGDST